MTARENGSYEHQVEYVPERKVNGKKQGNKDYLGGFR